MALPFLFGLLSSTKSITVVILLGASPYTHICLPEHAGREVEIDTGEMAAMLDRLDVLKPAVREYDESDEAVKKVGEGRRKRRVQTEFIDQKQIDQTFHRGYIPSMAW